MKVIFLDCDGVINCAEFYSQMSPKLKKLKAGSSVEDELKLLVNPVMVERVNQITRATGAKIVWSSSWRGAWLIENDYASIPQFFKDIGIEGEVVGVTPEDGEHFSHPHYCRGNQIHNWLDQHPEVTKFIILDDSSDMGALRGHLVRPTWECGLQDEHVEAAIRKLN